jgi:hypothetical protein
VAGSVIEYVNTRCFTFLFSHAETLVTPRTACLLNWYMLQWAFSTDLVSASTISSHQCSLCNVHIAQFVLYAGVHALIIENKYGLPMLVGSKSPTQCRWCTTRATRLLFSQCHNFLFDALFHFCNDCRVTAQKALLDSLSTLDHPAMSPKSRPPPIMRVRRFPSVFSWTVAQLQHPCTPAQQVPAFQ